MCKQLTECRHGKDFERYAKVKETAGLCQIRHGKGDHIVISNDKGAVVVPVGHELGKGLLCKVVKGFVALGLASLMLYAYLMI